MPPKMTKDPDFDSFFTAYKDDIIVNPSIEISYDPGELDLLAGYIIY